MKIFEVTYVDIAKTWYWTESDCIVHFGKNEWPEYKANYLPHVFVCEVYNREAESYPPWE